MNGTNVATDGTIYRAIHRAVRLRMPGLLAPGLLLAATLMLSGCAAAMAANNATSAACTDIPSCDSCTVHFPGIGVPGTATMKVLYSCPYTQATITVNAFWNSSTVSIQMPQPNVKLTTAVAAVSFRPTASTGKICLEWAGNWVCKPLNVTVD